MKKHFGICAVLFLIFLNSAVFAQNQNSSESKIADEYVSLGLKEYDAGNFAKAFEYWQKGADLGDAWAFYNLGICYYDGEGTARDYEKAAECFFAAAAQNHAGAINWLGNCYYRGNGVEQDYKKTFECYKKAADLGNSDSFYNLGLCYEKGIGVSKNLLNARFWYKKAASCGDEKAKNAISRLKQKR